MGWRWYQSGVGVVWQGSKQDSAQRCEVRPVAWMRVKWGPCRACQELTKGSDGWDELSEHGDVDGSTKLWVGNGVDCCRWW